MRDGRGSIFRMGPFDGLVVIAVDDENGGVDRLQLIVGPVRLVRPHLADLIDEGVVFLGRRGMLGIFMAGPLDIGGESRVFLDALDHAGGDRVGAKAKTLPTRSLCRIARSMPRMPPSLQPTTSAFGIFSTSMSATTSSAMRS